MGSTTVVVTITQDQIDTARSAGACKIKYAVGSPIENISRADAVWLETELPELSKSTARKLITGNTIKGQPLLSLLVAGDGYGDGAGDGYGDGAGDGAGYGDGYGVG